MMMFRTRHRRSRGQSTTELALAFPILLVVVLAAVDLAQGFRYGSEAEGAARAGMMAAIQTSGDVGSAIRSEPNNAVSATAAWGQAEVGGSDDCQGTHSCGDPAGCANNSSFWTTASPAGVMPTACFAVRSCTLAGGASNQFQCSVPDAWGATRVEDKGVEVHVVLLFKPITPFAGRFGTNGGFYVPASAYGLEMF